MNGSLHKSKNDKMILGVCGGVSEYLGVDSSIVRILWAVASFVYGSGILLYVIAAFILPYDVENDNFTNHEKNPEKRQEQNKVIAIILIMSGSLLFLRNFTDFFNARYFWPGLLILAGLLLIIKGKVENNDEK